MLAAGYAMDVIHHQDKILLKRVQFISQAA
jgi:hypothetical protein